MSQRPCLDVRLKWPKRPRSAFLLHDQNFHVIIAKVITTSPFICDAESPWHVGAFSLDRWTRTKLGKVRPARPFYAARGHLQKHKLLSWIKPKTFFYFFLFLLAECQWKKEHARPCRPFFALHQFPMVKMGHLRMRRPFFCSSPIFSGKNRTSANV